MGLNTGKAIDSGTASGRASPSDGGNIAPGSRPWFDWVDVSYPRLYRAVGNSLTFGSGTALGLVEITVTGFSAPGIEVYDVTDPLAPLRVTGITIAGVSPYSVTFRTDASEGERRFVAVVPGSEITLGSGRVVEHSPSNLSMQDPFLSTSLARTIIIAPESFIAAASAPVTRLADYRRGQGYVVQVAGIQDVYDEFNGGLKSPLAIRRYLRHAYLAWTPRLMNALLIGDASMAPHDLPTSSVVAQYFGRGGVQLPRTDLVGTNPGTRAS
jgi:hypothetical protein